VTRISEAGQLVRRTDFIRRIVDTRGDFLVVFSEHAAYYHTTAPALQQIIREAHAAKREVAFAADRHCKLHSVTMHPPRSLAQRIADRLERLTDIITRRSKRW
jgi:hypothetical protein